MCIRDRQDGAGHAARPLGGPHHGHAARLEHNFQRRGVGTQLLSHLLEFGANEGIQRVVAYMLPENRGMIEISEKLGFAMSREEDMVKAVKEL